MHSFCLSSSYITITHALLPLILIMGKDNVLCAFHSVCQRPAYTVATKERGCSLILRCRYHGWSYDAKGKLIKAPEFDGVYGFEKERNGLFEVQIRIWLGWCG